MASRKLLHAIRGRRWADVTRIGSLDCMCATSFGPWIGYPSSARMWPASAFFCHLSGARREFASLPPHEILKMPALSPTMEQGIISAWHVKEGDQVQAGDVIADVQTDKATMAFEMQDEGFIAKILAQAGPDIMVGTPVAVLTDEEANVAALQQAPASDFGLADATSSSSAPSSAPPASPGSPSSAAQESTVTGGGTAHLLGPAARVLMEAHGLAPSQITPTGPRGNITKGDVLAAVEAGTKPAAKPAPPKAAEESPRPGATVPSAQRAKPSASAPAGATAGAASSVPTGAGAEGSEDVPTTTMRKVIARRLLESKTQVPHAFFQTEVCMDEVAELRKALASRGVKVSVNDLVLAAAAAALKEVPGANVTWDEAEGRPRALPAVDINVAVATDAGLITPIVTGADRRGLLGISKEVKALATRAKENKLKPEEFMGGSFTLSNLGMFGTGSFYAIVNPPQGAILAVGRSVPKVMLAGSKPVQKSYMTASLSADSRAITPEIAAQFLDALRANLESPSNFLLM